MDNGDNLRITFREDHAIFAIVGLN